MKTFVTPHARRRFRERFRLFYRPEIFQEGREIYKLMDLFSESIPIDFALRQKPGAYNKLCIKHGCLVRFSQTGRMCFVWTEQGGKRGILTVMRYEDRDCQL